MGSGRAQPAQPVPCFSRRRPPGLCHPPGISVFPSAGLEEKTIIRSLGRRQRGCGTGQWRPVGQGKGLGSPRVLPHPLQHSGMQEGALLSPPHTLAASTAPHCTDLVLSAPTSDPGMKEKGSGVGWKEQRPRDTDMIVASHPYVDGPRNFRGGGGFGPGTLE